MYRVAIFIDGGYVEKFLRNEFNFASIDFSTLPLEIARHISPDIDVFRTYYYHCQPYKSSYPTPEEEYRFSQRQSFFDALKKLSRYIVKFGRLARHGPDKDGAYSFEQKMVDVLLSVDLVRLSARGAITHAAIIAGDSDFVPAIEAAKENVSAWLFHSTHIHQSLWDIADERVKITTDFINRILRPNSANP